MIVSIRHSLFNSKVSSVATLISRPVAYQPITFIRTFRSAEWFTKNDKDGFINKNYFKNQGWPPHLLDGRPIIGITSAWSEFNPGNAHLKQLSEFVKRGVWEAGGFPLEFPVSSFGDNLTQPASLIYRNLMSIDVEEGIRSNPVDGVVLIPGCDKTLPAMLMGAASCDLPTILVSGGAMLNGKINGVDVGAGMDIPKLLEDAKTEKITQDALADAGAGMYRSVGYGNTLGTASTMACAAESLGLTLPGNGSLPAVDARRNTLAFMSGRRIVEMVKEDLKLSKIINRKAFENAIKINAALNGSTNFIIHMLALAYRFGVMLDVDDFYRFGKEIPVIANLQPLGKYLMEDFCYAGGLPAVMKEIKDRLVLEQPTVNGKTLGENFANAECYNRDVIKTVADPVFKGPAFTVLRGNTARLGVLIRTPLMNPNFAKHRGRALVFDSVEDYIARVDDPEFEVHETNVLVIRNAGPRGYPGMGEIANLPVPSKILKKGFTDIVRLTDGRVSGSAPGTILMHCCPEAAVGGTISIIRMGDMIDIDLEQQKIHLGVSKEEIQERLKRWRPPLIPEHNRRGWTKMYYENVTQLDKGADQESLIGRSGTPPISR